MNSEKYNQYSVQDFLLDTDFLRYVLESNARDQIFWDSWNSKNPDKKPIFDEAVKLVKILGSVSVPQSDFNNNWKIISKRQQEIILRQKSDYKYKRAKYGLIIGTIIISLLSLLLLYFINKNGNNRTVISTDENHIASVVLPDGSDILLNKNSRAEVAGSFLSGVKRKLFLEGEMYIKVKPSNFLGYKQKFEVMTGHLTVDVLGTAFNIKSSESGTQVFLEEGKIVLKDMKDIPVLSMEPGDYVEVDRKTGNITRKKLNNTFPLYWKNKEAKFELSPVSEALEYLSFITQLPLENKSQKLIDKKFTGIFPPDNQKLLIKALEEAFDLTIETGNKAVIVKDK